MESAWFIPMCEKDTVREDTWYFITSLTNIHEFAYAVRKHWSTVNQLHWNLDVIFREDAARSRKDNSPFYLNIGTGAGGKSEIRASQQKEDDVQGCAASAGSVGYSFSQQK